MDCTGSSMTMKRNGLSGRVARGTKRLRASECSSPWLMTPRAAPSTPSTVTSRTTRRRVPSPVSWIRPSSTWLCWRRCSQIPAAFSAIGAKRSSRIPAAAFLSQASAGLRRFRSAAPRTASRAPASQAATSTATGRHASSLRPSSARAASRRRTTASRSGPLADSTWSASSPEVGDRSRLDPDPQRLDQLAEVQAHSGRPRERIGLEDRPGLPTGAARLRPARGRRPPPAPLRAGARCGGSLPLAPGAVQSAACGRTPGSRRRRGRRDSARARSRSAAASRERAGGRPPGGLHGRRGRAHLGHGRGDARRLGWLEARDPAQHVDLGRARCPASPAPASTASTAPRSHSLPSMAATTCRARSSSTLAQPLEQAAPRLGRVLQGLLAGAAGLLAARCWASTRSSRPRIEERAS